MRVLRFPEVRARVGYSRMHINRLERAGKFPKRVRLGPNSVGWVEDEVETWLAQKIAARDSETVDASPQ
jgi:prophage regulatory protein